MILFLDILDGVSYVFIIYFSVERLNEYLFHSNSIELIGPDKCGIVRQPCLWSTHSFRSI